ncbi:MAG: ComEC/Rec2 family competence protein [Candidatus Pacebacteria bacterium]|nr:ComEC/Rec2 family competence protein [Candidatus Paceibacterota bacterium]
MRDKEITTFSKAFFFYSLSFILGILFAPISFLIGVVFCLLLFYVFSRDYLITIFCLLFFVIGFYCFHFAEYNSSSESKTFFTGKVVEASFIGEKSQSLTIKNKQEKVVVYTYDYPKYHCGETVSVKGEETVFNDKKYLNYLRKEGVASVFQYPTIELKKEKEDSFHCFLLLQKEKLKINIEKSLPTPHRFLLEAMILGERGSFTDDFNEKLSVSGTRHITAISGMHIVILSGIIFFIFLIAGFKKGISALLTIIMIVIFILFIGAPASAVRAGTMGGVVLLASVVNRKASPLRLLAFVGAVMLFFNPFLLHYDLGFQLSFLAVLGIITLYPRIKKALMSNFIFFKKRERLTDVVAITTGAQIFVFPLILYNFGHISIFSIFANVLIVPLLPFVMIAGFLTALTGWIIFSIPIFVILSFIIFIINLTYNLPFSAIYITGAPTLLILLLYAQLFTIIKNKKMP